jgi:flagellar biosynthesis component FlhA
MFSYGTVDVSTMRSLKRDLWKSGIVLTWPILLLALTIWIPASTIHAQQAVPGLATRGVAAAQATPTADSTMTVLQKEQLTQQIAGQQHTFNNWVWSNAATIVSSFPSTLVVIIGLLIGFRPWRVGREDARTKESRDRQVAQDKELGDRRDEREKRAEERFQAAVTELGNEKEGARIGAAMWKMPSN